MRYIIALFVSLLYMPDAMALCFWNDVACIAPYVLPGYAKDIDPRNPSTREWSAYNGITFGYGNRIITRVRFDQEAIDILRSNSDFGLEIEVVLEGPNKGIALDHIETTFPLDAQAGRDSAFLDSLTSDPNSRNVAVHVLNLSVIEPEVDYFIFFVFKNLLPSDGVNVKTVNLQITLDMGNPENRSGVGIKSKVISSTSLRVSRIWTSSSISLSRRIIACHSSPIQAGILWDFLVFAGLPRQRVRRVGLFFRISALDW